MTQYYTALLYYYIMKVKSIPTVILWDLVYTIQLIRIKTEFLSMKQSYDSAA
jgi:hypothetical protein